MAVSNITADINCDIQKVWDALLAVENYPKWRSDLSKAEVISREKFVEYTKDGYPTTFTVTAAEPLRRWEFDIDNGNISGHWTGVLTARGEGTQVDFTENVTVKKFIMKLFVKGYLKKQQELFVGDLKKYLEK